MLITVDSPLVSRYNLEWMWRHGYKEPNCGGRRC